MRLILTHKRPDLDAVVSTWLAQEFLFAGEESQVVFVDRKAKPERLDAADCVVDVGNAYDPERLRFDHKPPAFEDRNSTCATRLLWEHLIRSDHPVAHLESLVRVAYEGDTRKRTLAYKQSRIDGPHAELSRLMREPLTDGEVYEEMAGWLRARYVSPTSGPHSGRDDKEAEVDLNDPAAGVVEESGGHPNDSILSPVPEMVLDRGGDPDGGRRSGGVRHRSDAALLHDHSSRE